MSTNRLVGVTVMPEYFQNETVDGVLDNLQKAGVNAVTTSPYVMEEADEKTGGREPPIDAGAGAVRLLDRPLWGKRELWMRTAPSFAPNRKLYQGLRYQPPEPNELTSQHGSIVHKFIEAAKSRGLKVYFQVQAAIPPGYRVQFGGPVEDDRPLLPDGRYPDRRVANNGSLASPHIRDYADAMIRDLVAQYPDLDGIRFDWPEYPPYFIDTAFFDFSPHAKTAAQSLGFDFQRMQQDVLALYKKMHGSLTNADLSPWVKRDGGRFQLVRYLADHPGVSDWLRFKALLSERLLARFRKTMDSCGGKKMEMQPNAFPPPWTIASGFDFRRNAKHSSAISVKLYGMHWAMMLRFYGNQLLKANPKLSDALLARSLVRILDIVDDNGLPRLEDYRYPGPDEPHPGGVNAQIRKIEQAQTEAGKTPIYALAHGYGPLHDFRRRLETANCASSHGFWLNRYGYLSDDKLEVIGRLANRKQNAFLAS